MGCLITPNPAYELIYLSFWAQPGGVIIVDSMHIATECVPEPSAAACVGIGLAVLLAAARPRARA
jgi:hypothetical protein